MLSFNDGRSESLVEFTKTMETIFGHYGYVFFDASDPVFFGSNDEELIDIVHGSETMMKRLFVFFGERGFLDKKLLSV